MPAWLRWQALSTNPAQLQEHMLAARSLVRAAHTVMLLAATGALMGSHVAPYWDPIFAIALSLWVVWAWGGQARVHILNLVGLSAPPALLQAGRDRARGRRGRRAGRRQRQLRCQLHTA